MIFVLQTLVIWIARDTPGRKIIKHKSFLDYTLNCFGNWAVWLVHRLT